MKKILLFATLLACEQVAQASCYNSNVQWKMYITNKTPYTLTLDCGATIPSGAVGIGSGSTVGKCGGSAGSAQCTYKVNGHTGTLMLNYASCDDYNLVVSASVNTAEKFPLPFACHVAPSSHHDKTQTNYGQPCPMLHSTDYYDVYSVTSYFTISENTNYNTVVWKNVVTNLVKGQVMANKLARSLLNTENYANVTGHYDGQNITIKVSGGVPTDPYTSDTSCN